MRNSLRSLSASALATALLLTLAASPAYAAGKANLSTLDDGSTRYGQFLVKFVSGSDERKNAQSFNRTLDATAAAISRRVAGGKAAQPVGLKRVRRTAIGADVIVSSRPLDRVEATLLLRTLANLKNVEYAGNDMRFGLNAVPNDTDFSKLYGLGTGAGGIRAPAAWDSTKGEGVVVAVLDTGINPHSDLNANVLAGYDFIGADASTGKFTRAKDGDGRESNPTDPGDDGFGGDCGFVFSPTWHGTHVTGTIAAVSDNAKGVAGAAPAAKVVPVRVAGYCGWVGSDLLDAIVWASGGSVPGVPANPNPADVINMSLGAAIDMACPQEFADAYAQAAQRGTILVHSAGNDDQDISTGKDANGVVVGRVLNNCGNAITVGANDSKGARAWFSNYGTGVDIAAPGAGIYSTLPSKSWNGTLGETYGNKDGTSMAAPHVSGVIALVQSSARTPLTVEQMRSLLKSTARPFPEAPGTKPIGAGIVDADAAVKAAKAR